MYDENSFFFKQKHCMIKVEFLRNHIILTTKRWLIDAVKINSTLNTNQFQHNISCQGMSNYRP